MFLYTLHTIVILCIQKKLKAKNDVHKKSIVGLTTEMVDVKKRIRALLNKSKEAQGPDYDEYKITRKISKSYEPIDPSRSKVLAAAKKAADSLASEQTLGAVTVTVPAEDVEENTDAEDAASEEHSEE